MYAKLITLLTLAVLAFGREYPAGVHPAVCPNYPYCDMETLARFTPDGQPIPAWGLHPALVRAVAPAEYPAGVHPAICPNYPYCDTALLARYTPAGIPIPEWEQNPAYKAAASEDNSIDGPGGDKYPADFNPALCPNYPYCH